MSRKADLEQHIKGSYHLVREYEDIQRLSSDPKERTRAERVIQEQKDLINSYLSEYVYLCKNLGFDLAQDITEIAVTTHFPLSASSSFSKSWFCQGCGHANPKGTQFCHQCGAAIRISRGDQSVEVRIGGVHAEDVAHVVSSVMNQSHYFTGKENQAMDAYALLIGVGNYTHSRYSDLPATVEDVQAIAGVLADPNRCGYSQDNVQTISGEQATVDGIRNTLKTLAESTNTQSTVFVYFSGHGGRALENGNWRAYICPREANPDALADTAISGDDFSALLAAIPARKMLVVLDACHAGGSADLKAADGTLAWKAGLPENYYVALSQGSGRAVIASSKEDQFSYVRSQGDLSVFTWHFRDALIGKAAVRGDGLIHVLDVFHYVNEMVQLDKPEQTPILKVSDMDLNFAIALDRGGKGLGTVVSVPVVTDIREQIVRDPVYGSKALSEFLRTQPKWTTKRNEVDLKRNDLERIQHELDLFGPDPQQQAAKNRIVFFCNY